MAKGKKSVSHTGPHKNHGPKKHMFKEFKPLIKAMADAGLLSKYYNYESFAQACSARGKRNVSKGEFLAFTQLPRDKQEEFFK